MAKPHDFTETALQGYRDGASATNPFLWSSASHIAFRVGQWLNETGRSAPRNARMSRGYSFRCNDMVISWNTETGACERIS